MQKVIDDSGVTVAMILSAKEFEKVFGYGVDGYPKRILKWSINRDSRGAFRAQRRIAGKTHSLYLGKTLDGAEQKISQKEACTIDPEPGTS